MSIWISLLNIVRLPVHGNQQRANKVLDLNLNAPEQEEFGGETNQEWQSDSRLHG
jgi:hypothetical protein